MAAVIDAQPGDDVKLDTFEYKAEGDAMRVARAVKEDRVYTRKQLEARKAMLNLEIAGIDAILAEMDKAGI